MFITNVSFRLSTVTLGISYFSRLFEADKKKTLLLEELEKTEQELSSKQAEELKLLEARKEDLKNVSNAQSVRRSSRRKLVTDLDYICNFLDNKKIERLRQLSRDALRQPESSLSDLQMFFKVLENSTHMTQ